MLARSAGGGYYHATKHSLEALTDALRFEVEGFGIDVVLIQAGLIRTNFSEVAVGGAPHTGDDSPYRPFMAEVKRITRDAFRTGVMSKLAGDPEDVARTTEIALNARRPKTRYPVTASARILMTLRALFSDRLWDAFMARSYPRPGRG